MGDNCLKCGEYLYLDGQIHPKKGSLLNKDIGYSNICISCVIKAQTKP